METRRLFSRVRATRPRLSQIPAFCVTRISCSICERLRLCMACVAFLDKRDASPYPHVLLECSVAGLICVVARGSEVAMAGWPGAAYDRLPGPALMLLLSGLEIEFERLRGRVLSLTSAGFAVSFVLAPGAGALPGAGGL